MFEDDFDIQAFTSRDGGLDTFFGDDDPDITNIRDLVEATVDEQRGQQVRVASVDDLDGFDKIAEDTLIRRSERDLWSVEQTEDGEWVVERLFDEDGNPLKV